jgi:phosphatidylglycerophosphatase A
VDAWSKRKSGRAKGLAQWKSGFGVIADDLLAGLQAWSVIQILHFLLNHL